MASKRKPAKESGPSAEEPLPSFTEPPAEGNPSDDALNPVDPEPQEMSAGGPPPDDDPREDLPPGEGELPPTLDDGEPRDGPEPSVNGSEGGHRPATDPELPPARPGISQRQEHEIPGWNGTPRPAGYAPKSFDGVDELADALQGLSGRIHIKVKRLEPDDLPSSEMGQSAAIALVQDVPTAAAVENLVRKKWGGGRYEITIYPDAPEMAGGRPRVQIIHLEGDWEPRTMQGHMEKMRRMTLLRAFGGTMTDPATGAPVLTSDPTGQLHLFKEMKQIEAAERSQERQLKADDKRADESVALRLLEKSQQPAAKTFDLAGVLTALSPLALGLMKMMEDSRARSDAKFEKLLETLGTKSSAPTDMSIVLKGVESVLDIQAAAAKKTIESQANVMHEVMKKISGGDGGPGTVKEAILGAVAERGGDAFIRLLDIGKILLQSRQAAVPQMAAMVQNLQNELHALKTGQALPAPAAGATSGAGVLPPEASGAPVSTPVESAPSVATDGSSPATAGAPAMAPADSLPDPIAQGKFEAERNLGLFTFCLVRAMSALVDVSEVWEGPQEGFPDGVDLIRLFNTSPANFRQRVQTTDPEGTKLKVADWFEGFEVPEVKRYAAMLVDHMGANKGAIEWLRGVLQDGPWTEHPDED